MEDRDSAVTKRKLYVRKLATREIVSTYDAPKNRRAVEGLMSMLLRNMRTDEYYVDDSEAYDDNRNKAN